MYIKSTFAIAALLALVACSGAFSKESAVEQDFGNSVAAMRKAQTANPAAAANPSTEPVTGVDPDYANAVLEAMREDVSKPADVREPITIRVGGEQGGT